LAGYATPAEATVDRVVIKELDPDRVRRSGLLVAARRPRACRWPSRSAIAWSSARRAGVWIEVDEERLLVCRVGELLGLIERATDRE
jgi:chaperonin GroES